MLKNSLLYNNHTKPFPINSFPTNVRLSFFSIAICFLFWIICIEFFYLYWNSLFNMFRLYQAAEDARLQKRLRDDLGGTLRAFTERDSACFAPSKEYGSEVFFTSQERQWLVLHLLNSLRASDLDVSSLHGNARVFEGQSIGKSIYIVTLLIFW